MALENRKSTFAKRIDRGLGIPLVWISTPFAILFRWILRLLVPQAKRPRILIQKFSALGDAVVMLPALRAIEPLLSRSDVTIFCGTSNQEIFKRLPFVKRIETLSLSSLFKLGFKPYDLVLDFEQWMRFSALTALNWIHRESVGFRSPGQFRHEAYSSVVDFDLSQHTARNFYSIAQRGAKILGEEALPYEASIPASLEWRRFFSSALTNHSPVTILHPGCGEIGSFREWPQENWIKLARDLQARGETIVLTGSGEYENSLCESIASSDPDAKIQNLVGKLPFDELLSLLSNAKRVYCCNTGIMHLASFLSGRVVALHGPTRVSLWGTLWGEKSLLSSVSCSPCLTWGHDYGCKKPICMQDISPEKVISS